MMIRREFSIWRSVVQQPFWLGARESATLAAADPELYLYLIRYSHLLQISGTIRLNQVHISLDGFDDRVQTPLEYVTEWRMQKAVQLLQRHDKKLIDVAQSVGYESDAAFSKAFKRVVGLTPGEYRHNGGAAQQQ
jgi:hypothetical protein